MAPVLVGQLSAAATDAAKGQTKARHFDNEGKRLRKSEEKSVKALQMDLFGAPRGKQNVLLATAQSRPFPKVIKA